MKNFKKFSNFRVIGLAGQAGNLERLVDSKQAKRKLKAWRWTASSSIGVALTSPPAQHCSCS